MNDAQALTPGLWGFIMFKDLFDFGKDRTAKEAVLFYAFHTGVFFLVTTVLGHFNGQ